MGVCDEERDPDAAAEVRTAVTMGVTIWERKEMSFGLVIRPHKGRKIDEWGVTPAT